MFKKILIANRGEIAVRIVRECRDMGIWTVVLYEASDRDSLHVRLADECVELHSDLGYMDGAQIIEIARRTGAEAIHPGYGFLAEQPEFVAACEEAGIAFVGPSSDVMRAVRMKIELLGRVKAAGFATTEHSSVSFRPHERELYQAEAAALGFPLLVKACSGGRGRATRLVRQPEALEKAVQQSGSEARVIFGDDSLYLERAILPANYVDVQILGDRHGNVIHLGERDGSIQRNNQKLVCESPAPGLTQALRARLHDTAVQIARLFNCNNAVTIEFLLDQNGTFYFTEIKARITVEHPVTEMVTRRDLVREQIEIAAGKRLSMSQEDVRLRGAAIQCRINAEDPWNHYLPSPGVLQHFRLPGGPRVRVDTYGHSGCPVPVRYDPILAKVVVWGEDRPAALQRMERSLQDFVITGVHTNLPLFQLIMQDPDFLAGAYTTEFLRRSMLSSVANLSEVVARDLAVAAAVAYAVRMQGRQSVTPPQFLRGWHRASRQLPG
ncbi:MAG: ATP-grasp domain-containing protein [Anaerolinea sp.]|nr:ATP-grasp domain-containing protein [Anaerolinea sp.]